jgi:hypothetical protein
MLHISEVQKNFLGGEDFDDRDVGLVDALTNIVSETGFSQAFSRIETATAGLTSG